ncbi:hypothetical protein L6452_17850 [Arctium lappa]|uniref:Uncharacterized protein n=1 Tax=Arctium lappa TaxID=4217 RepID=A0ACB9C4E0_ARCLA|nr:hypothetical protein L6452_17850 [Arctium lappa]
MSIRPFGKLSVHIVWSARFLWRGQYSSHLSTYTDRLRTENQNKIQTSIRFSPIKAEDQERGQDSIVD